MQHDVACEVVQSVAWQVEPCSKEKEVVLHQSCCIHQQHNGGLLLCRCHGDAQLDLQKQGIGVVRTGRDCVVTLAVRCQDEW